MNEYLKLFVYVFCVLASMYGLSAIRFENYIKKNKVNEVTVLYFVLSLSLGYLLAQMLFSFTSIRL